MTILLLTKIVKEQKFKTVDLHELKHVIHITSNRGSSTRLKKDHQRKIQYEPPYL